MNSLIGAGRLLFLKYKIKKFIGQVPESSVNEINVLFFWPLSVLGLFELAIAYRSYLQVFSFRIREACPSDGWKVAVLRFLLSFIAVAITRNMLFQDSVHLEAFLNGV